ncbi:glycosyltransferase [Virgibacillus siamensis]|uniref:Glycosyltransferase n=1 Tax=Virgibacillus siamensis TaxID=480071 RepID=A0ABP3RA16_9BACI
MISLSYIIPTFNNLHLLKRCIKSIEGQLDVNDRVIIVDDGSNDNTYDYLLHNYSEKLNFIILNQKNSGSGIARNYGLNQCNTDYLWFIDSDDYIEENASSMIKSSISKNNYDILFINYNWILNGGTKKSINTVFNTEDFNELLLTKHYPWNKIIKRKIFEGVNFPNKKIRFQDHATIPVLLKKAQRIGSIKSSLYNYDSNHLNNISKDSSKNDDIYIACDYLVNYSNQGIFTEGELEIILINTLLFAKLFNHSESNIKEIRADYLKIKKYLDVNTPKWKESGIFKLSSSQKYKHLITNIKIKICIGRIFKYSISATYLLVYILLRIKRVIM